MAKSAIIAVRKTKEAKMPDCLYQLPQERYKNVTQYLKKRGVDARCSCARCEYFGKRIQAKGIVRREVYDSGTFQQSLRAVQQTDYYDQLYLSPSQIEKMMKTWWNY